MAKEEIEYWFTANGNHIPVMKGQTKQDAFNSFLKKNNDVQGMSASELKDRQSIALKPWQKSELQKANEGGLKIKGAENLYRKILLDEGKDNLSVDEIINDPIVIDGRKKLKTIENQYGSTDVIDTEERKALRRKISDDMLSRGSYVGKNDFSGKVDKGFRAEIVIGKPAAGKSKVIVEPSSKETNSRIIDSDEIKKELPEFMNGDGAGVVHQESADILEQYLMPHFYEGGDHVGENLVLPIVGKKVSSVKKFADKLRQAGYDVHLSINSVKGINSLKRAVTRYLQEGRFLDPNYVVSIEEKPEEVYEQLKKEGGFASYTKYDNNAGRNDDGVFPKAKLVEKI